MSRFGEVQGRPSEFHPKSVAKALGLKTDGPTSWSSLLDAACCRYWELRSVHNPVEIVGTAVDSVALTAETPCDSTGLALNSRAVPTTCTLLETGGEAA